LALKIFTKDSFPALSRVFGDLPGTDVMILKIFMAKNGVFHSFYCQFGQKMSKAPT
jgi:hypothetical protein